MEVNERIVGPRLRRVVAHEGERTSQEASTLRPILEPSWTILDRLQRRQLVASLMSGILSGVPVGLPWLPPGFRPEYGRRRN